jgi:hypothetical protein
VHVLLSVLCVVVGGVDGSKEESRRHKSEGKEKRASDELRRNSVPHNPKKGETKGGWTRIAGSGEALSPRLGIAFQESTQQTPQSAGVESKTELGLEVCGLQASKANGKGEKRVSLTTWDCDLP